MDQITAAPETHDSRPPVVVESAPNSGAAAKPLRTTATQRAITRPLPWKSTNPDLITYPTDHPYIRLYWTATIGPGAVADMMGFACYCRSDDWLVPVCSFFDVAERCEEQQDV